MRVLVAFLFIVASVNGYIAKRSTGSSGEERLDLVEGDMIAVRNADGSVRNAINNPDQRWPKVGKVVPIPYVLDRSLSSQTLASIQGAIKDYEAKTCIRLVPRKNEQNFVKFFAGDGCYANVGYIHQPNQEISLGQGCEPKGKALHEIMHTLGFFHEQSRPDRDQYVGIVSQNIAQGAVEQFVTCKDCSTQGLPYDYGSVMHYGADYFTANGRDTIVIKQKGVDRSKIGQREGLSQLDVQKINKLYQC